MNKSDVSTIPVTASNRLKAKDKMNLAELFAFPRVAWERSQGALRRELRLMPCVYGTQRVRHCIPTQRVGTRKYAGDT